MAGSFISDIQNTRMAIKTEWIKVNQPVEVSTCCFHPLSFFKILSKRNVQSPLWSLGICRGSKAAHEVPFNGIEVDLMAFFLSMSRSSGHKAISKRTLRCCSSLSGHALSMYCLHNYSVFQGHKRRLPYPRKNSLQNLLLCKSLH